MHFKPQQYALKDKFHKKQIKRMQIESNLIDWILEVVYETHK